MVADIAAAQPMSTRTSPASAAMNNDMRRAVIDAQGPIGLDRSGSAARLAAASRSAGMRSASLARSQWPYAVPTRPVTLSDQEPCARDARARENEHGDERDAGKAPHRPDRVGIGRGPHRDSRGTAAARAAAGRRPRRRPPADAPSRRRRGQGPSEPRPRGLDVPTRTERERGERQTLRRGRRSSPTGLCVAAKNDEAAKDDQQTRCALSTRRPATCPASRARSRGPRTQLRDGPRTAWSERPGRRAGRECHEHEPSRCAQNPPFPPARDMDRGRSGQQQQEECAREQHAWGEMNPVGGEQQRRHSTWNVNRPSVTWPSTESTRQITV